MARPLRIEYEDAIYHVMNRGNGFQDIFHGKEYFELFLNTVAEACERFGIEIHAYCLMSNHYHLLVKTPRANLGRAMRHINGVYTQRYNRLCSTDGVLFRGRYKAIVVDSDAYLLHVSKYIHLNPLEAGMVDNLTGYQWSSYPAYIEKIKPQKWLERDHVYGYLTSKRVKAKCYQEFVEEKDLDIDVESFYSRKRMLPILGDEHFIEEISRKAAKDNSEATYKEQKPLKVTMDQIIGLVGQVFGVATEEIVTSRKGSGLKNQPRRVAMYLAQEIGDYRLNDIAERFGLAHYGGVANAIYRVKQELDNDRKLMKSVKSIIKRLDPQS